MRLPLHQAFRYIHEPLPANDPAIPGLGHDELLAGLLTRLRYSHGGAFLVTGFRGVGKSTLVLRALEKAAGEQSRDVVLLPVYLNAARQLEADQLLFAIVRRIFEALEDSGLFERLAPDVQNSLLLAYMRTSLSFKQTHSDTNERGGTLGMSPQQSLFSSMAPTLSLTGKRISAQAMEASFLAYSELDVEHDLVRIIQLLDAGRVRQERRGLLRRRRITDLRIHPVIVLDEVDKRTEGSDDELAMLQQLIGRLKSVLTTRGAHFLLIGGADLHDSALRDVDRGNGLYESVFAWRLYVPCLWEAPERLVHDLVRLGREEASTRRSPGAGSAGEGPVREGPAGDDVESPSSLLDALVSYLRFKSRGVLRRLLQEFNALVEWGPDGRPVLALSEATLQRVRLYSGLEAVVAEVVSPDPSRGQATLPIDDDRRRLGGYHVVDWVLRSRRRVFTAAEIEGQLDPLLHTDIRLVERLLRHLVDAGVITMVGEGNQGRRDATVFGQVGAGDVTYCRLTDSYADQLWGIARESESERADLAIHSMVTTNVTGLASPEGTAPPEESASPVRAAPGSRLNSRYEVYELIGQGGMGAVYRGLDVRTNEQVAVKILHGGLAADGEMRARFLREGAIGARVRHPHVARTLDVVEGPDFALIIELVEGPTLREFLHSEGALSGRRTVRIADELGQALVHLASLGLARVDLKPSNVILHPRRGSVIVDLGVARRLADVENTQVTRTGMVIGTPGYMSPEQVLGNVTDARSDLFTLGLLLYECLLNRSPYDHAEDNANQFSRMYAIMHNDVDVSVLPVSDAFREVIRTCTRRAVEDRYQSPAQFLSALRSTPEAMAEEAP
ncbi:serine/threonine-protein kinase [Streptomyces sp. UH6]|uniref:serine/threonine-protein kinase n=1 Tax=Streptomyces sp. UH6 TaxID=2748379 RepID=UPI0015D49B0A|nr:serine/threonine-protein kinase [Streptomyces sp. UH6]NYV75323.1 serine/threonine protein kinase [Streptomyces sp. UH6]